MRFRKFLLTVSSTALGAVAALALLHPYLRQSLFGPSVKGEPLWAWQQLYRQGNDVEPRKDVYHRVMHVITLRYPEAMRPRVDRDPDLLPAHLSLRDDPSWRVRRQVAKDLLAHVPATEAIAALKDLANDPHAQVRLDAMEILARHRDRSLVPTFRAGLADQDPRCRAVAAYGLWAVAGSTEGLPVAVAVLAEPSEEPRQLSWLALLAMGKAVEPYHAEVTIAFAAETFPWLFERRLSVLAACGPQAIPTVLACLDRAAGPFKEGNRARIASRLGEMGDSRPEVIRALERLAVDEDWMTRYNAAQALFRLRPHLNPFGRGRPQP